MAKYLATFNDALGEIEVNGFVIMTDKEVETFEELASSITWPFNYSLSDEDQLEYNCGDDLLSRVDFKEINPDEAKLLKRLFNNEFGTFIDEEALEKIIGEESESDEDDDFDDDDIEYDKEY